MKMRIEVNTHQVPVDDFANTAVRGMTSVTAKLFVDNNLWTYSGSHETSEDDVIEAIGRQVEGCLDRFRELFGTENSFEPKVEYEKGLLTLPEYFDRVIKDYHGTMTLEDVVAELGIMALSDNRPVDVTQALRDWGESRGFTFNRAIDYSDAPCGGCGEIGGCNCG